MNGNEFLRKLKSLSRKNGWDYDWRPDRGKGSHGIVTMNGKKTVVRNLRDELKTGTFHGMLSQLGIRANDLNE